MILGQELLDDETWEKRAGGRMLLYIGPHLRESPSRDAIRRVLLQKGAWGALWNYDWDCGESGPWYSYICDTPDYELGSIKKKVRYYVRRSLKECEVKEIDPNWLAEHGYKTYINATSRYTKFVALSPETFRRVTRSLANRPGWQTYGVFVKGELAAYGLVRFCGQTLQMRTAKFDPAYSSANPMYALYYTVAHLHLQERRYADIDNGVRPLLHDTAIEDFLRRMGWRRAHCRLGLYLIWPVRVALALARMFRKPCSQLLPDRHHAILESLLVAQEVARGSGQAAARP